MHAKPIAAPLHWHQIGASAEEALPFMRFFSLDPSENPTVRPDPSEETLERIPGEAGLVVIARTLSFERGLLIVGRQRERARRGPRLDAAKDVA
jgi:hypothetical protein